MQELSHGGDVGFQHLGQSKKHRQHMTRQKINSVDVAVDVRFDELNSQLIIELANGQCLRYRPDELQGLENAKPSDLERFEISTSGLGIHFPSVDADISVSGLLQGLTGSAAWMAKNTPSK